MYILEISTCIKQETVYMFKMRLQSTTFDMDLEQTQTT